MRGNGDGGSAPVGQPARSGGRAERRLTREAAERFAVLWSHLVLECEPVPADAIFCFGSRHWRLPERTAALYRAGVAPRVLVTGGTPEGAGTEAGRVAEELLARGVPDAAIVVEDQARHTGENVTLGMAALGRSGPVRRLALVSWPLAARRCRATFGLHFPDVGLVSAPALRRPGWRWAPTRRRIRLALGEIDRLDRYARAGLIVGQERPLAVERAVRDLRHLAAGTAESPLHATRGEVEPPGSGPGPEEVPLLVGEA